MILHLISIILVFLYGIVIGSFLNVCIYRIPRKESIVISRSHCMSCGYQLRWYDLIPVLSWIVLHGRCRRCKEKISMQYPIIELSNGVLWVTLIAVYGFSVDGILYCLMGSCLLVISLIDARTYEIPLGCNICLLVLGIIRQLIHGISWTSLLDLLMISGILAIVFVITKGRGIGGGDIKLMAVTGLLLGWQKNLIAFMTGCLYGCVIHIIRMKVSKADHVLALGPYLAAGVATAVLFGTQIITWYLNCLAE